MTATTSPTQLNVLQPISSDFWRDTFSPTTLFTYFAVPCMRMYCILAVCSGCLHRCDAGDASYEEVAKIRFYLTHSFRGSRALKYYRLTCFMIPRGRCSWSARPEMMLKRIFMLLSWFFLRNNEFLSRRANQCRRRPGLLPI
jgi:hypothetical protein